jgi:hypothetical protein
MAIDLNKIEERKESIIDLKKRAGIGKNSKAQVVLALDFSGSMSSLYGNGTVQDTVERILPFGLAFDDNGEVDAYIFEDKYNKIKEPITLNNLDGYVDTYISGKYEMGGTSYAPVLNGVMKDFALAKSGGFLGFGGKQETTMEYPVYVIFITDGENFDKSETEKVIREMSAKGFFVQFIGIGNSSFSFLEKLDDLTGRTLDNANFFKVSNLKSMTDDTLYQGLMKEYPQWLLQAKDAGLVK